MRQTRQRVNYWFMQLDFFAGDVSPLYGGGADERNLHKITAVIVHVYHISPYESVECFKRIVWVSAGVCLCVSSISTCMRIEGKGRCQNVVRLPCCCWRCKVHRLSDRSSKSSPTVLKLPEGWGVVQSSRWSKQQTFWSSDARGTEVSLHLNESPFAQKKK